MTLLCDGKSEIGRTDGKNSVGTLLRYIGELDWRIAYTYEGIVAP